MKNLGTFFTVLTISAITPGLTLAGQSCGSLCNASKQSIQASIADPKCKSNPTCLDCVANSVLGGQQGTQCQAYNASDKSNTKQTISTALFLTTGITCTISCVITNTPWGASLEQALSKACAGLGLASSVADVGMALAAGDMAGGMMGALTGFATMKNGLNTVKNGIQTVNTVAKGATDAAKEAGKQAGKKAKNNVCMNAAIFMGTAIMKKVSQDKIKKSRDAACKNVESLATITDGPVQACLAKAGVSVTSTAIAGIFSPTPETFPAITKDDAIAQEITAGKVGEAVKEMQSDLDLAAKHGIDMNAIAKRLNDGESASAIASGFGLPSQVMDPIKEFEDKANAGGKSAFLTSLMGGDAYGGGGTTVASVDTGTGDLAFGVGATPGEGAGESIEIDRQPAAVDPMTAALADGDVFHGAFGGSIFDIVTYRLKEQKGNYAELDPEGRMNRLFNGYGEPGTKGKRKPASSDRSAK